MALALQQSARAGLARPGAVSRRPVPVVRAFQNPLADVAKNFLSIFSKPNDTVKDWSGTGSGFSGKISHHGAGRPFKDGYQAGGVKKLEPAEAAAAAAEEAERAGSSYLGDAVERVVAHNFTGDETEPPAGAGAAGWKGDTHDRKKGDGFHARKV